MIPDVELELLCRGDVRGMLDGSRPVEKANTSL
jgi:hypothetical protein